MARYTIDIDVSRAVVMLGLGEALAQELLRQGLVDTEFFVVVHGPIVSVGSLK